MLTRADRAGFTLVEVIVALAILSSAVLGLAASASRLATTAAAAELRALALSAVEDRIAEVRLDPRYALLDSIYEGTDDEILGPGTARTTTVTVVDETAPFPLAYTRVLVSVGGTRVVPAISRQIVVAAP